MKKLITFVLLCASLSLRAQFTDSFNDGNFTADPPWTGDAALFEVNSSNQLHLEASAADTAFLVTPSSCLANAEWSFWMKMSFNTSSNNHARVYLVSDMEDLEGPLNGYFLQAGGSDDSVSFYRQQGMQCTRLLCCSRLFTGHSTNTFRFRVTRDTKGNWEIAADSTGNSNYFTAGSVRDTITGSSAFFGAWCRFTSSNGSKFYFDDFYSGPIQHDTLPPRILRIEVSGENLLKLFLSEAPDQQSAVDTTKYLLEGTGTHPGSAGCDPADPTCVILGFETPFPEPTCDSLRMTGISDRSGNIMADTSTLFCHFHPGPCDIVINEILADPYPYGSRFIELYNRTGMAASLRELTITYFSSDSSSSTTCLLSGESFILLPMDYAVLCEECEDVIQRYNAADTTKFIRLSSFPSLAAKGGTIILSRTADPVVIDRITYSEEMHNPLLSSTEGISLERVSPDASSQAQGNWHSAAASAGYATPGSRNSQWWLQGPKETGEVTLDPEVFSPDNDGTDDLLHIICHPTDPDCMATVAVYDSHGRKVRQLAGNELIASKGSFTWDGIIEEGTRAPAGIYIVYAELVKTDGTVERFKKTAVVAVKF